MAKRSDTPDTRIAIFQRKEVRRTLHNNEWWFVIADVVAALTDTQYINKLQKRDPELAKGWVQMVRPLIIPAVRRTVPVHPSPAT